MIHLPPSTSAGDDSDRVDVVEFTFLPEPVSLELDFVSEKLVRVFAEFMGERCSSITCGLKHVKHMVMFSA